MPQGIRHVVVVVQLVGDLRVAVALVPGCASWDGHFCLFGYTTRPLYDLGIRTVRVPIFNR